VQACTNRQTGYTGQITEVALVVESFSNYMALLLTEEGKLAEILAALTIFQCVTFVLLTFTLINLVSLQTKIDRYRPTTGERYE
jgi:hypothetical protein